MMACTIVISNYVFSCTINNKNKFLTVIHYQFICLFFLPVIVLITHACTTTYDWNESRNTIKLISGLRRENFRGCIACMYTLYRAVSVIKINKFTSIFLSLVLNSYTIHTPSIHHPYTIHTQSVHHPYTLYQFTIHYLVVLGNKLCKEVWTITNLFCSPMKVHCSCLTACYSSCGATINCRISALWSWQSVELQTVFKRIENNSGRKPL